MKKIISIILLVFLFAACAQNGESSANTDRETQSVSETTSETSYYEILGERNFNGYTFTIIDANDYPGTVINFPEEDGMTGEPINDALYIRDK
ncbi:MAG: membrane lipoprotein lipid attachment site-containing protein, partial [Oscillospiraceae bacterium]|nr:membrane lipoprotein lipid attachment site-containing protein [Oscillospiraceae bacterium]